MQVGLMRRLVNGKTVWLVSVRPKNTNSLTVLPHTFKTPYGALWAARKYWGADD